MKYANVGCANMNLIQGVRFSIERLGKMISLADRANKICSHYTMKEKKTKQWDSDQAEI
jgi:hypothetical protein